MRGAGCRQNGAVPGRRSPAPLRAVRILCVLALALAGALTLPAARAAANSVTIGSTPVSRPIPSGFLGISTLPRFLEAYAGDDPAQISPAFLHLYGDIAPGQTAILRFGGEGADQSWYPLPHHAKPPGVGFTITDQWLQVARATAEDLHAKLILGVNFEAGSQAVAAGEAQAMTTQIGRAHIDAIEIGNEPELYTHFAWYRTAAGLPVYGRDKATWTPASYRAQYRQYAAAMPKGVTLGGPVSGLGLWLDQLGAFIRRNPEVGLVTMHAYPLKHCRASHVVTIANVLSAAASQGFVDEVAPFVRTAQSAGKPIRIDETNAITCGGTAAVSNSFATALWGLNTYFGLARLGIAGLNVNMVPGSINSILDPVTVDGHQVIRVQPEYYAMIMFAAAAPPGSEIVRVAQRATPGVTTWATRATGGQIHAVIVNQRTSGNEQETVTVPQASGPAQLETLRAPHLASTTDVTLGGQTFGGGTRTGLLTGTPTETTVTPIGDHYTVDVPAGSAAMLTFGAPAPTLLVSVAEGAQPLLASW